MAAMAHWLFKTEPSEYAYATLERAERAVWDGVSNPVALRNLRAARRGDTVVVYHTGDERAAVGLAEVTREAFPDPKSDDPKRVVVEIAARGRLAAPVGLAMLKAHAAFAESPLVRQGRLSIVPLSTEQWTVIRELGAARRT
jgi:predicted RNA-binding protein with PUA-like domain